MNSQFLIPISGVYTIVCQFNKRTYVGQSIHIARRWLNHVEALSRKKHNNKELQRDFTLFDLLGFDFNIIEECGEDRLLSLERSIALELYQKDHYLYNTEFSFIKHLKERGRYALK